MTSHSISTRTYETIVVQGDHYTVIHFSDILSLGLTARISCHSYSSNYTIFLSSKHDEKAFFTAATVHNCKVTLKTPIYLPDDYFEGKLRYSSRLTYLRHPRFGKKLMRMIVR